MDTTSVVNGIMHQGSHDAHFTQKVVLAIIAITLAGLAGLLYKTYRKLFRLRSETRYNEQLCRACKSQINKSQSGKK